MTIVSLKIKSLQQFCSVCHEMIVASFLRPFLIHIVDI